MVGARSGTVETVENASAKQRLAAYYVLVEAQYFETSGTRLIQGRQFTTDDGPGSPLVAIVTKTTAARLWPDTPALGRRLLISRTGMGEILPRDSMDHSIQVVGVSEDVDVGRVGNTDATMMYLPWTQSAFPGEWSFLIRARDKDRVLTEATRIIGRNLMVVDARDARAIVDESVAIIRVAGQIVMALGLLAILLAGVGVYGLIGHTVRARRKELGIRMALGSPLSAMVRSLSGGFALATSVGVTIGLASAMIVLKMLGANIVGLPPISSLSFALVGLASFTGVALACSLPVCLAWRSDPTLILRDL